MKKRIRGAHSLRYPSIFVNFLSLFVGRGAGGWGQVGYQGGWVGHDPLPPVPPKTKRILVYIKCEARATVIVIPFPGHPNWGSPMLPHSVIVPRFPISMNLFLCFVFLLAVSGKNDNETNNSYPVFLPPGSHELVGSGGGGGGGFPRTFWGAVRRPNLSCRRRRG